ncbi:39S ribosomal protein L52, mitochondrial [Copidosoma floridanum]|uniref:39S ribosomal protein L52, mitochondrial n=1 Tax=Copidosoma floridanum TaxID=29053 RepID=UPI0006C94127|nr:39S ribosomal protein L52, mitochondrial [Copidosoma floridanum]XP_014210506.1 39S ribosomal protein L52, mitochondrial [Copidosoma floridanum]
MTAMLQSVLRITRFNTQQSIRQKYFDVKWRENRNLPRNPNSFGPLTNLPDYSFTDGRPVPYGTNQKRRIDKQREHLIKIKKLVGEVDRAVERHKCLQEKIQQEKQQIIDGKLKEKGKKILAAGTEVDVQVNKS